MLYIYLTYTYALTIIITIFHLFSWPFVFASVFSTPEKLQDSSYIQSMKIDSLINISYCL